MDISVIGSGYVGLVTGVCFAELGNKVICVDSNKEKIAKLKRMVMPIFEPGLEELIRINVKAKRLFFGTEIKQAVRNSGVIFIAVGTPSKDNGEADLTYVEDVAKEIAKYIDCYKLIVEKSTVPVETGKWIEYTVKANLPFGRGVKKNFVKFDVASNPEFLREGQAIEDFMHPDRIVIGVESKKAQEILTFLYKPLKAPIVVTDIKSAELIKHASNSFLATKISFINAISQICCRVGADISKVADGMGLDKRIGRSFLDAGIGYGGSCFPKDVDAFIRLSEKAGYNFSLLKEVKNINEEQKNSFVSLIEHHLWILKDKTIGILGLAFKSGTDDMRNAPSIDIIKKLQLEGAKIKVFDPRANLKAKEFLKDVEFCKDPYEVAKDSDCLAIITEWNEFKELDFIRIKKLMKQPLVFDGRNIYNPDKMRKMGFKYFCVCRIPKND
ncbi:MAG: UDP-glucose/GDP-mannose dehydrogenase family protein [Candidatus Omnitrophota bacterium]|nr:UDP-glucose/GDP-mannose dehydrogenase family protein [Candidatus Omnitrophota bacterium]